MGMITKACNFFDQSFKCLCKIFLVWSWQPFVSTKFKARFDGWYFTSRVACL